MDLRLSTLDYNLRYSGETYGGPWSVVTHAASLPFVRARHDPLWFFGGAGLVLGLADRRTRAAALLSATWIAVAVVSIAINGARDLPQYFVQAAPALALAAATGLCGAWQLAGTWRRATVVLLLFVGLWRPGTDEHTVFGMRLAGLPGLSDNLVSDLDYLRGRVDRETYLARFGGQRDQDKFAALEVDRLAALIRETTAPEETVLVFGFAPGAYVQSGRQSASRFFWSRPVVVGFASERPGYGAAGLLEDLEAERPALVVLQKRDWAPFAANSAEFFVSTPALSGWLSARYDMTDETDLFTIWRRRE
jgi:hypothetical protein